jgi:hypothetical protein
MLRPPAGHPGLAPAASCRRFSYTPRGWPGLAASCRRCRSTCGRRPETPSVPAPRPCDSRPPAGRNPLPAGHLVVRTVGRRAVSRRSATVPKHGRDPGDESTRRSSDPGAHGFHPARTEVRAWLPSRPPLLRATCLPVRAAPPRRNAASRYFPASPPGCHLDRCGRRAGSGAEAPSPHGSPAAGPDDGEPACVGRRPPPRWSAASAPASARRSLDRGRLPPRLRPDRGPSAALLPAAAPPGDVPFRPLPPAAPKRDRRARGSRYAGPAFGRRSPATGKGRSPSRQQVRLRPLPRATGRCAPRALPHRSATGQPEAACLSVPRPRPPRCGSAAHAEAWAAGPRRRSLLTATRVASPRTARTPKRALGSGFDARASPAIPAALPHPLSGPKPVHQTVGDSSSRGRRATFTGPSASPKRDPAAGCGDPPVPPARWSSDHPAA